MFYQSSFIFKILHDFLLIKQEFSWSLAWDMAELVPSHQRMSLRMCMIEVYAPDEDKVTKHQLGCGENLQQKSEAQVKRET